MLGNLIQPDVAQSPTAEASELASFQAEAHAAFRDFVLRPEFPCVGARAAFHSDSYVLSAYEELGSEASTAALAENLLAFTNSEIRHASEYATFIAVFRGPEVLDEVQFEAKMWQQLERSESSRCGSVRLGPNRALRPGGPAILL